MEGGRGGGGGAGSGSVRRRTRDPHKADAHKKMASFFPLHTSLKGTLHIYRAAQIKGHFL